LFCDSGHGIALSPQGFSRMTPRRFPPPWSVSKAEHPDQQRIRSFGGQGVLCAPTAHLTNGTIGVSPETE
jgi:hypothetical protein